MPVVIPQNGGNRFVKQQSHKAVGEGRGLAFAEHCVPGNSLRMLIITEQSVFFTKALTYQTNPAWMSERMLLDITELLQIRN